MGNRVDSINAILEGVKKAKLSNDIIHKIQDIIDKNDPKETGSKSAFNKCVKQIVSDLGYSSSEAENILKDVFCWSVDEAQMSTAPVLSGQDWKLLKDVMSLADDVSDKAHKLSKVERALDRDVRYLLGDVKRNLKDELARLDDIISNALWGGNP